MRQKNILDLFCVNNPESYLVKDCMVNKKFLDHNLLYIEGYTTKNINLEEGRKMNPYENIIYEYDTESTGEEWYNFEEYFSNYSWEPHSNLPAETQISDLYELLNKGAETFLKKRGVLKKMKLKKNENISLQMLEDFLEKS